MCDNTDVVINDQTYKIKILLKDAQTGNIVSYYSIFVKDTKGLFIYSEKSINDPHTLSIKRNPIGDIQ